MIVAMLLALVQAQPAAAPPPPPTDQAITPPRLINRIDVSAFYPSESLQQEQQGLARLRCTLLVTGRLAKCGVETSSGWPLLDEASFRIAEQSLFSPQLIDGVPTEAAVVLPVRWLIGD